jgi:hypothetical protein
MIGRLAPACTIGSLGSPRRCHTLRNARERVSDRARGRTPRRRLQALHDVESSERARSAPRATLPNARSSPVGPPMRGSCRCGPVSHPALSRAGRCAVRRHRPSRRSISRPRASIAAGSHRTSRRRVGTRSRVSCSSASHTSITDRAGGFPPGLSIRSSHRACSPRHLVFVRCSFARWLWRGARAWRAVRTHALPEMGYPTLGSWPVKRAGGSFEAELARSAHATGIVGRSIFCLVQVRPRTASGRVEEGTERLSCYLRDNAAVAVDLARRGLTAERF